MKAILIFFIFLGASATVQAKTMIVKFKPCSLTRYVVCADVVQSGSKKVRKTKRTPRYEVDTRTVVVANEIRKTMSITWPYASGRVKIDGTIVNKALLVNRVYEYKSQNAKTSKKKFFTRQKIQSGKVLDKS